METASGMGSLIKTLYALRFGIIPPQAHFSDPDPEIDWDTISVRVPTQQTSWPEVQRRSAGISCFGFTGTNAHVTLQAIDPNQAPAVAPVSVNNGGNARALWPGGNFWLGTLKS
jgi:acyl transferase domain-containing protein